jgi:glycosyltransferase involved in cell wall biosynthesis
VSRVGNVIFLVAGEGPHRGEFESQVRTLGLEGAVRFLGRREDVSELISMSTLVVMPSLAESFGFSALEAMSLGKPVVASSTGGIPEVVVHRETGLLVPPADSDSLADAICQVLVNPSFADTLGRAGKRRSALFTFDRMISGYEAIYERINLRGPFALGSKDEPSATAKRIETIVKEH